MDQAVEGTARHFSRRVAAMKSAVEGARQAGSMDDFVRAASAALVELAATWSPAPLAGILGDAIELAAWEGREATFGDAEAANFAAEAVRLSFREQIDFLAQKRVRPTRRWTDAMQGDHDRAFVVAGATDTAMLEEMQSALIRAAREGLTIDDFAEDFDRIADAFGWVPRGNRDWRIRTIFETNLRTSFMAGRLRQMRDPDVVKLRPYWQYIHGESRVPLVPRKLHLDWDGLVLMWDDPWWETHFPPNDWLCSCGVRTLSKRDLKRLGKDGPDEAPLDALLPVIRNGELVMQPQGVGTGWDYMPGDLWERGLVPSALLGDPEAEETGELGLHHRVEIDRAEPLENLLENATPFTARVLPDDMPERAYVEALLRPLGSRDGRAVLFTDKAGQALAISGQLFYGNDGRWKGGKRGHATHAGLIAETLMDPDEIWLGVRDVPIDGQPGAFDRTLTRRYVKVDPTNALTVVLEMGRKVWREITGYASFARSKPDHRHIDRQRVGKLLWKRKD